MHSGFWAVPFGCQKSLPAQGFKGRKTVFGSSQKPPALELCWPWRSSLGLGRLGSPPETVWSGSVRGLEGKAFPVPPTSSSSPSVFLSLGHHVPYTPGILSSEARDSQMEEQRRKGGGILSFPELLDVTKAPHSGSGGADGRPFPLDSHCALRSPDIVPLCIGLLCKKQSRCSAGRLLLQPFHLILTVSVREARLSLTFRLSWFSRSSLSSSLKCHLCILCLGHTSCGILGDIISTLLPGTFALAAPSRVFSPFRPRPFRPRPLPAPSSGLLGLLLSCCCL